MDESVGADCFDPLKDKEVFLGTSEAGQVKNWSDEKWMVLASSEVGRGGWVKVLGVSG